MAVSAASSDPAFDATDDSRFGLFLRYRFTPRQINGATIGATRIRSDHGRLAGSVPAGTAKPAPNSYRFQIDPIGTARLRCSWEAMGASHGARILS
jgi:hypothetical protein